MQPLFIFFFMKYHPYIPLHFKKIIFHLYTEPGCFFTISTCRTCFGIYL